MNPLLQDTLAVLLATSVLLTGGSPRPFVMLGEIGGLGFGLARLALCTPWRY